MSYGHILTFFFSLTKKLKQWRWKILPI